MTKVYHILNLGAGWQSTALYLMSLRRDEPEHVPLFDYAIFADTQEEPRAVYEHVAWLKTLGGPPILEGTIGKLGDDYTKVLSQEAWDNRLATIERNRGKTKGKERCGDDRFTTIPAYCAVEQGNKDGIMRRQCTKEYKIEVIEKIIKSQILGVPYGRMVPDDRRVVQYIGMSLDEPRRVINVKARFQELYWSDVKFPLFDMRMNRGDCGAYLKEVAPGREIPRSACVFCPFHRNHEWVHIRDTDPEGWERACQIDEAMRAERAICTINLDDKLYLHESCVPLREAVIDVEPTFMDRWLGSGVQADCTGYCGN